MTDRLTDEEIEEIWDRYESATDARFIAHARTDIPRLLDEVERLREERDRYREALTAIEALINTLEDTDEN